MTPIKCYPSKLEKVDFFGTCLIDIFYPEAGFDGIRPRPLRQPPSLIALHAAADGIHDCASTTKGSP